MIIINGKKFAENESEFLDSLFQQGGTCVGYVKKNKRAIKLFDMQKKIVGVINQEGVIGKATTMEDGKTWYSYGDIELLGKFKTYSEQVETAGRLAIGRDSKGYYYK